MKFGRLCLLSLIWCSSVESFTPASYLKTPFNTARYAGVDMPPPQPQVIQQSVVVPSFQPNPNGAPVAVRYSEFCKLVDADKIEKFTFMAD